MKYAKKLAVFTLTSVMTMAFLTGCGTDGGSGSSAASGASAASSDSSSVSSNVVYTRGSWEGNTYTNSSLGFVFTMPDGWTAQTDDELMATMDSGYSALTEEQKKNYDYSQGNTVYDFAVSNADKTNSLGLMVENLALTAGASGMTEQNYADVLANQLSQIDDMGYEAGDTYTMNLHGQEYLVLPVKATKIVFPDGTCFCQDYILRKQDQLMTTFIGTYIEGEEEQFQTFLNDNLKAL